MIGFAGGFVDNPRENIVVDDGEEAQEDAEAKDAEREQQQERILLNDAAEQVARARLNAREERTASILLVYEVGRDRV